jgi:hypothetical protein
MGYRHVGTIEYYDVTYTVWVNADPKLDEASWQHQKAQYFPDYDGPPPSRLSRSKPNGGAPQVENKTS